MEELKTGTDEIGHSGNVTDACKKRSRHRKKLIINKLRVQMEFYFSDANLGKDKYMRELLDYNPYIELELFFSKFNRIRSLTDNLKLLKCAVEKSPMLELSEDGTKVKRTSEAKPKRNERDCTIYVENIPSHVDQVWVHEVFAKYGTIDYISLPCFKSTSRPKGFAFVEFETPAMANAALERFGAIGGKIPTNNYEPSKLQSVVTNERFNGRPNVITFDEGDEIDDRSRTQSDMSDGNGNKGTESEKKGEEESELRGKRKMEQVIETDENNDTDIHKSTQKKVKFGVHESSAGNRSDNAASCTEKDKECGEEREREGIEKQVAGVEDIIRQVRKNMEKVNEVEAQNSEGTEVVNIEDSVKKRSLSECEEEHKERKKQKLALDSAESSTDTDFVAENKSMDTQEIRVEKVKRKKKKRKRSRKLKESVEAGSLKVMSKAEWSHLRNLYLNKQKKNMESLKLDLQRGDVSTYEESPAPPPPPPPKKSGKGPPQYVANAIIKITFEEPPQDPKKLQEAIREWSGGGMSYVETTALEKDVYVRFVSGDSASAYLKAGLWSRMILLSGEEESEYWEHCVNAWHLRYNKKNKQMKGTGNDLPNECRGREKLLQKALKEASRSKPMTHKVFD